jgi:two-component system sensor histidine kinase MprB
VLAVRDHGPGIPDELKSAVFEPFRRENTTGVPGTGMGLSIVARTVQQAGGEGVDDACMATKVVR